MTYTAATNSLASESCERTRRGAGCSPTNSTVVVNDQLRGILYLYTPCFGSLYLLRRNRTESRLHRGRPDGLHRGQRGPLHPQRLHWLVGRNPARQPGYAATSGICPATNTTSPIPTDPTCYPPNTTANPNNTYNVFLLSRRGGDHSRLRGVSLRRDDLGLWPVSRNHGHAGGELSRSRHGRGAPDHVASTTDGKHIIGASANPADADGSLRHRARSMPAPRTPTGKPRAITFNPPPVVNQTSLAAYGINNINQVVPPPTRWKHLLPMGAAPPHRPAGGALLPVYKPSTTAGALGTLSSVTLDRQCPGAGGRHLLPG